MQQFPSLPPPRYGLVGHRGYAGLYPENTAIGFTMAAKLGLTWVELDVHLLDCGDWIVIHDDTLDRTTNGSGSIYNKLPADLKQLEAGLNFATPVADQNLLTLTEALDHCTALNLCVNIEVKGSARDPARHAHHLQAVLAEYTTLPLCVSSFDLDLLTQLRDCLPTLPLGCLAVEGNAELLIFCEQTHCYSLNLWVDKITPAFLHQAKAQLPVWLYTVNDPRQAQFWLAHGVSAIFTDEPEPLLQQIR